MSEPQDVRLGVEFLVWSVLFIICKINPGCQFSRFSVPQITCRTDESSPIKIMQIKIWKKNKS